MKILIVYDSKHGTTEKICRWIKEGVGDATLLRVNNVLTLDYDLIIVGSPIYFGKPLKSVLRFLADKMAQLKDKRVTPFVVCIRNGKKYLEKLKRYLPNSENGKIFGGKFLFIDKLNKEDCIEFGKAISSS